MRMTKAFKVIGLLLLTSQAAAGTPRLYRLVGSISAPAALWDYASIDPSIGKLYVGRIGGVLAVDLASRRVIPILLKSALVHGVAPLPGGLAAASNGAADSVTIFEGRNGTILGVVPAGKGPDAILYDPDLKLLIVADSRGNSLTLIDPARRVMVGSIALGGRPEAFAPDGHGQLYDNIADKNQLAIVNVAERTVTDRIPLPGCREPTGIALDQMRAAVISACRNGVAVIVSTRTRRVLASLKIGTGPDAVMLDPARGYALIPSGSAGVLNVIGISADGTGRSISAIPTEVWARTGAVDPRTGDVYLPVARLTPPAHAGELPSVVPGTFRILVYSPRHQ